MTQARIDLMNDVGFDWGRPLDERVSWEDRYKQLLAFKEVFGHTNVTQNKGEYNKLAMWVSRQRAQYQAIQNGKVPGEKGLTEERIRLLNEAGFVWRRHKYKNRGGKKQKVSSS